MAIEKTLNMPFEEICAQLGISEKSLLEFLGNTTHDKHTIDPEKPALYVLEKYQEHLMNLVKINKRSEETLKTYNNFIIRIKKFLALKHPHLKINELNEIMVNEIITNGNQNEHSFSVRTINKYYAIIKSILKFAYEMDFTHKDFRNRFQLEKTSLLPRYIKEDEIKKILETIDLFPKSYRCRAIIMFLLLTGCRVSEVSKIKIRDFNVMENLIYIYRGKGNRDRIIPMFPQLKEEILFYLQKSGMTNWNPKCDGYLFARDEGTIRNRNFPIRTIEYLVERIRNRIPELSHITVHSFRHTFAVFCLKTGIKEHHLTEVLGHFDPKTTMTYTKLRGEDLREEIINKFPYPFEILLNTISEE